MPGVGDNAARVFFPPRGFDAVVIGAGAAGLFVRPRQTSAACRCC